MSAALLDAGRAVRVPAQFMGVARQLRRDVRVEDTAFDRALAPILAPLHARLRRHPRLRHEQIAGCERAYRATIPHRFRVSPVETDRDRAAFSITEHRVSVSWLAGSVGWPDDYRELGLTVCRFALTLRGGRLSHEWIPIAQISLHAIARRFERGRDAGTDAVLADLALLVEGDPAAGQVPCGDAVWLGDLVTTDTRAGKVPLISVRTFVAEG